MNSKTITIEDQKLDEAQRVVLSTLFDNNTPAIEADELGRMLTAAGGLQLFDSVIYCELWRRADAAIKDGKLPNAYLLIKQVEPLKIEVINEIISKALPIEIVEEVYIPELVEASYKRRIRLACKQAAECENPTAAVEIVREAARMPVRQRSNTELSNEIIDEWERATHDPGRITGVSSGFVDLDKLTWGWQPELLYILAARPSCGKTAMLVGFSRVAAIENKLPTLFCTFESTPKELIKRLACQISKTNQVHLRAGYMTTEDASKLCSAFGQISSSPLYIVNCIGMGIVAVQNVIRSYVERYGARLVLVDYLQKIRSKTKEEKKTYEISQVSEGLKSIAEENHIPIVCAAQLNRESEKQKGRPPMLSDLKDSGSIEQDADGVAMIHRITTDGEDVFNLIVPKMRDGRTGIIPLVFLDESTLFENGSKIRNEDCSQPQRRSVTNDN